MSLSPPSTSVIPEPLADDDDDVSWALQTAAVQWRRGARPDALTWLRRAAETAIELQQWSRAADLNAAAARLEKLLDEPQPSAAKSSLSQFSSLPAPQRSAGGSSRPPPHTIATLPRSSAPPASRRPQAPPRRSSALPPPPPQLGFQPSQGQSSVDPRSSVVIDVEEEELELSEAELLELESAADNEAEYAELQDFDFEEPYGSLNSPTDASDGPEELPAFPLAESAPPPSVAPRRSPERFYGRDPGSSDAPSHPGGLGQFERRGSSSPPSQGVAHRSSSSMPNASPSNSPGSIASGRRWTRPPGLGTNAGRSERQSMSHSAQLERDGFAVETESADTRLPAFPLESAAPPAAASNEPQARRSSRQSYESQAEPSGSILPSFLKGGFRSEAFRGGPSGGDDKVSQSSIPARRLGTRSAFPPAGDESTGRGSAEQQDRDLFLQRDSDLTGQQIPRGALGDRDSPRHGLAGDRAGVPTSSVPDRGSDEGFSRRAARAPASGQPVPQARPVSEPSAAQLSQAAPRAASVAPSVRSPAAVEDAFGQVRLSEIRGLGDLPPEAHEQLIHSARIESLAAGEEVSFFAVALVLDGWVSLMPAIVDAACATALVGEVVFTEGTLRDGVALRVVAGQDETRVAVWNSAALGAATADCPWIADDLRLIADGFQALAGASLGPLGERLDDSLRGMVTARCEVRTLLPSEVIVVRDKPVPGMHIVGGGEVEIVDAADQVLEVHGAGEFLFTQQVLGGGSAPFTARAGAQGALVLFAPRPSAHELLVSVPPLLEILAQ